MMKKFVSIFALMLATTTFAQTPEITVDNVTQDAMLVKFVTDWASISKLAFDNKLEEKINEAQENHFAHLSSDKQKTPSATACAKNIKNYLVTFGSFSNNFLTLLNNLTTEQKQKIRPFTVFLHSNDGQEFATYFLNGYKILLMNLNPEIAGEPSKVSFEEESKKSNEILHKQKNANEISEGLIIVNDSVTDEPKNELMNMPDEIKRILATPECQEMKKEEQAFKAKQTAQ